MKSYWWKRTGPCSSMTVVLIKWGNTDTDTRGECHVSMKAEIAVMHLQAEEHQRFPTKYQKLSKGTNCPLQPSEGTNL